MLPAMQETRLGAHNAEEKMVHHVSGKVSTDAAATSRNRSGAPVSLRLSAIPATHSTNR